jgi:hypothetical protein
MATARYWTGPKLMEQELSESAQSGDEAVAFVIDGVIRHGHEILFAVLVRTL